MKPHTCCTRTPGKVEWSQKRSAYCTEWELVPIVPYLLSHCVQPGRESSISCFPSACLACLRKGRVLFQQHVFLHLWYSSTYSYPHWTLSLRAPFIHVGGLGYHCFWPCRHLIICLVSLVRETLLCTALAHSNADHVGRWGTRFGNWQSLKSFGKLKYLLVVRPEF